MLVLVALFTGITWWALESGGVAVVVTHGPDGALHSAHVWYVETNGELWLEAGSPESAWFIDVRNNPDIRLSIDGRSRRYAARVLDEPSDQAAVRALLRRKYGIRDRWVAMLVDSSRSVAVRLEPTVEKAADPSEWRGGRLESPDVGIEAEKQPAGQFQRSRRDHHVLGGDVHIAKAALQS